MAACTVFIAPSLPPVVARAPAAAHPGGAAWGPGGDGPAPRAHRRRPSRRRLGDAVQTSRAPPKWSSLDGLAAPCQPPGAAGGGLAPGDEVRRGAPWTPAP